VKEEAKLEAVRAFAQALGVDLMKVRVEKQKSLEENPHLKTK